MRRYQHDEATVRTLARRDHVDRMTEGLEEDNRETEQNGIPRRFVDGVHIPRFRKQSEIVRFHEKNFVPID